MKERPNLEEVITDIQNTIDGKDTCDDLIPLLDDALSVIKKLEPHVIGLNEIEDGEGYWWTTMSSDFKPRPVICVHYEKDAEKPYITFVWQYGIYSLEAETYGIEWCLWSAKPIGREWRGDNTCQEVTS